MGWREYFEGIRAKVLALADLEQRVEEAQALMHPKGQRFDKIGHGGSSDKMAAEKAIELSDRLDLARTKMAPVLDAAIEVLYGSDGHGGLARAKGSVDADILCGYYLQGMGWGEVAEELSQPGSTNPAHWCRTRAMRAFEWLDKHRIM